MPAPLSCQWHFLFHNNVFSFNNFFSFFQSSWFNCLFHIIFFSLALSFYWFHARAQYLPPYVTHLHHNRHLTQVWLVGWSCPSVIWEYHQVGIRVSQWLHPVTRRKRGHHQDAVILLAVEDPLWHLTFRAWLNSIKHLINFLSWAQIHLLKKALKWPTTQNIGRRYRLSDIEDFPSLRVKWHQPGRDEVSSPRLHSAVQHLIQIHLDNHNIKLLVH